MKCKPILVGVNNECDNFDLRPIQEEIIKRQLENFDKTLFDFFEPQLRGLGVKGELTAGKLKWRGIKMHVYQFNNGIRYQLYQRGVAIGKSLDIDLNL
jgi:hypothetical protein